jgi:hypothetical protein
MEEVDERQGRAVAEAARRRRRGDETISAAKRLPIPPEVQAWADAKGMSLRWVNDEGNRIVQLTQQDDYDKVDGVEPVPVVVDRKNGTTVKAHLLAKRKDFIAEDRADREQRRRDQEKAMVQGATPDAGQNPENPRPAQMSQTYVARGTSISRGNQILE